MMRDHTTYVVEDSQGKTLYENKDLAKCADFVNKTKQRPLEVYKKETHSYTQQTLLSRYITDEDRNKGD